MLSGLSWDLIIMNGSPSRPWYQVYPEDMGKCSGSPSASLVRFDVEEVLSYVILSVGGMNADVAKMYSAVPF